MKCWRRMNIFDWGIHIYKHCNDLTGILFIRHRLTDLVQMLFVKAKINAKIITIKCDNLSFLSLVFPFLTDSVCLVCYVSNGHLMAFSLPSLRLLLDVDFLPLADLRWVLIEFIFFDPETSLSNIRSWYELMSNNHYHYYHIIT